MADSERAAQLAAPFLRSSSSIAIERVSDTSLVGKKVAVTGATDGIGRAFGILAAVRGADVLLHGRDKVKLEEAAHDVSAFGVNVATAIGNIEDPETAIRIGAAIGGEFNGQLHVLVNNAGAPDSVPLMRMTMVQFDGQLGIHTRGTFAVSKAVVGYMAATVEEDRSGRIINIASVTGLQGGEGDGNYGAAKAAVINLSKTMAIEWGPLGIAVIPVALGPVETKVWDRPRKLMGARYRQLHDRQTLDNTLRPVARMMPVLGGEDIIPAARVARHLAYLASDNGIDFTGQTVVIDAGMTLPKPPVI